MLRFFQVQWLRWFLWRKKACNAGRKWAKGQTLKEAWDSCNSPDWMIWWLTRRGINKDRIYDAVNAHYRERYWGNERPEEVAVVLRRLYDHNGRRIVQG